MMIWKLPRPAKDCSRFVVAHPKGYDKSKLAALETNPLPADAADVAELHSALPSQTPRREPITVQPHPQIAKQESLANETIVAISTPPGRGGIGIVRSLVRGRSKSHSLCLRYEIHWPHAQARFAEILDPETRAKLDEAIVTYFAGPNSYTGEDMVEIAAHGSPVILDLLLRLALQMERVWKARRIH